MVGVYKHTQDGCKYRVTAQKIKRTVIYYWQCMDSKVGRNEKLPLDEKTFNRLLDIKYLVKLKQK